MNTPALRDFQQQDVAAVIEAHKSHRSVIGRAATGLGKAVELAALAHHYSQFGRVMVLVDVAKLVEQLAETIRWYTGVTPGIEMADQRAYQGDGFHSADRIVVSTVQTQYSGDTGRERYRQFDPSEFSAILLDECELFLAPTARSVVDWYAANPNLRIYGCTATPMRTDGVAMGELFDHVAFDRDIIWGIGNGWLVPARQAFVQVSVDFSTLKVKDAGDGERDYSAEEIASKIQTEQVLIELAKGIIHVCEDRKSIVVCPTVEHAKAIADYLNAERGGCARYVYGEMSDDDKRDAMATHAGGQYQFLTSVMMLTKGYDDPSIRAVVNCRKTKSKRLYQQILGRGTRPLRGLLNGIDAPDARRDAIASSAKPNMLMVNMVGIKDDVRDVTLVDILGNVDEAVADRAKQLQLEGKTTEEAIEQATEEVEADREQALREAEEAAETMEREDEARLIRSRIRVDAAVDVQYEDDLRVGGMSGGSSNYHIPDKQLAILRKFKVPDKVIANLTQAQASDLSRTMIARAKAGLCTYKQATLLQKYGYSREEVATMTIKAAGEAIDAIAANGWRRPREVA